MLDDLSIYSPNRAGMRMIGSASSKNQGMPHGRCLKLRGIPAHFGRRSKKAKRPRVRYCRSVKCKEFSGSGERKKNTIPEGWWPEWWVGKTWHLSHRKMPSDSTRLVYHPGHWILTIRMVDFSDGSGHFSWMIQRYEWKINAKVWPSPGWTLDLFVVSCLATPFILRVFFEGIHAIFASHWTWAFFKAYQPPAPPKSQLFCKIYLFRQPPPTKIKILNKKTALNV